MAETLPFLPRVKWGRVILSPARWRIDEFTLEGGELNLDSVVEFKSYLARWRNAWKVPQYVWMKLEGNLLEEDVSIWLNLEYDKHVDELYKSVLQVLRDRKKWIVLEEAFTRLQDAWLGDDDIHYASEVIVPLVLEKPSDRETRSPYNSETELLSSNKFLSVPFSERIKTPSSDWLYIKIYCKRDFEEDLISGPIRELTMDLSRAQLIDMWFFVRYADPMTHIRLRMHGNPHDLINQVLPRAIQWAKTLVDEGLCEKFSFDTYEREIERYGGVEGISLAEGFFAADSMFVAQLLHLERNSKINVERSVVAALSVDRILMSLGLSEGQRFDWCNSRRKEFRRRKPDPKYQEKFTRLRAIMQNPNLLREASTSMVGEILDQLTNSLALLHDKVGKSVRLTDEIVSSFVHMHCNRLFGPDPKAEEEVIVMLFRAYESLNYLKRFSSGQ